jgi:hypothetical protein
MSGYAPKICITCEHDESMPDTQLSEQGINCPDLDPGPPTAVAKFGCVHMIVPVWSQERNRTEPVKNLLTRLRTGKTLQKFLKNQTGRDDRIPRLYRADKLIGLKR